MKTMVGKDLFFLLFLSYQIMSLSISDCKVVKIYVFLHRDNSLIDQLIFMVVSKILGKRSVCHMKLCISVLREVLTGST